MTLTPATTNTGTESAETPLLAQGGAQLEVHSGDGCDGTEIIVEPISLHERETSPPLPVGTITTDKVPPVIKPQPLSLVRILMPVVMILMVGGMLALMLTSGQGTPSPMVLMFPIMIAVSLMTMFGTGSGEDIDDTRRIYLRHLGVIRSSALEAADQQRCHELHKHPDPRYLWSVVGSPRMWERGASDPDTLEVRLGLGNTALCTPVSVPDSGAIEDLDPVCAVALRHTVRSVGAVANMPVAVQLQAFRFLGLSGPRAAELARAVLVQLAYHHGPDAVGIEIRGDGFSWTKWLPHTKEPEHASFRVLVVNSIVTSGMEEFIDDPYWSVIIDVDSQQHTGLGQRALCEGLMLTASENLTVHAEGGLEDIGVPDCLSEREAVQCARALTAYRRPAGSAPSKQDFLSLLGIQDAAAVDVLKLWRERRQASHRLRAPIGYTEHGSPLVLDIKEAAHGGVGPHGLCIGATGSGKSELLRTLVLSLAMTHSPDELNLVLVDFKGGATFLGLENLPHTSAVITNLADEAELVERMHDAISGEMNRRQELLRSAGGFANVTEYNNAREADRPELKPLPALMIVLDEFSELLGQHPDFADLFVAVGRLGRSLQMHLLLASQRLEEGRLRGLDSHLSYRIGLKTFSASESRQVLGVADAYHLPAQPGAGFIKSDSENVTKFQASYVSGPLPIVEQSAGSISGVQLFNSWQDLEVAGNLDTSLHPTKKLLEELVAKAIHAGGISNMSAHPIWLPPLPPAVPLAGVADQVGELCAAVGIIDRPFLQAQDSLIINFSGAGGHLALCGGPQSGKTNALRTIVLSLSATHSTQRIRFYVLDFAGTGLSGLEAVPHVAGVAHKNELEKARRIVDEVVGLMEQPEKRDTFLVVDGWHAVSTELEDLMESFASIAADGLAARIHLILGTSRWSVLRPAIRDLIGARIELKLGEPMDSLIDRKAQQKLPAAPGRGLNTESEHILFAHSTNQDVGHVILAARSQGFDRVPKLKMLPDQITARELPTPENDGGIVFALGGRRLGAITWDIEACVHALCIGAQGAGKSTFLTTVGTAISDLGRESARVVAIDPRRTHLGEFSAEIIAQYAATPDDIVTAIQNTAVTLRGRLPGPNITATELKERSWWKGPEIFLLIDDADLLPEGCLHPLRELIPHSRDIGLHIVLARKAGGINRALFDPILAALRDSSPAVLLMDADKDEGRIFGVKPVSQPPGRGTWVERGEVVGICQVGIVSDRESEGE